MDAGAWIALVTFVFTVLCAVITVTWIFGLKFGRIVNSFLRVRNRIRRIEERLNMPREDEDIDDDESDTLSMGDSA